MKLKIFRIVSLVMFAFLFLTGLFFVVYNIILASNGTRADNGYLIYLIGMLLGILFIGFEITFIFKSFKHGTTLLHTLCLKEKSYAKRKSVLIVSLVILTLIVTFLIINGLFYFGILTGSLVNPTMIDFNFFFCLIILINTLEVIIYYLFFAINDVEVVD